MSRTNRFFQVAVLSALSTVATIALPGAAEAAESTGASGYVVDLVLNSPTSERYGDYQGSVLLLEGDVANAAKHEYKWGGTVCSGYMPGAELIRYLFEAMRAGRTLQVVPNYKPGVGGARCLVGFKVRQRPAPV